MSENDHKMRKLTLLSRKSGSTDTMVTLGSFHARTVKNIH